MHEWFLLSRGRLSELGVGIHHTTPTDSVQSFFVLLQTCLIIHIFF